MKKVTASSPTESGCTGVSKPVRRKGIVLFSSFILDLVKGTEVEILWEDNDCYMIVLGWHPCGSRLVPKELIQEVSCCA